MYRNPNQEPKRFHLPDLIIHADWSVNPQKRWMAIAHANPKQYSYSLSAIQQLPPLDHFLEFLTGEVDRGKIILVGLDFPLGLPVGYARQVGITHFREFLALLKSEEWFSFFQPAEKADQISLQRPFYPLRPGGAKLNHLIHGLNLSNRQELLRQCDLTTPNRRAAAPLFWTMGAQQAGKAALHGWKNLILPALKNEIPVFLWPFDGWLSETQFQSGIIFAESYPGEYLGQLLKPHHLFGSKRDPNFRKACAQPLLALFEHHRFSIAPEVMDMISSGFGEKTDSEDAFDAFVGLAGMLSAVLNIPTEPKNIPEEIRAIEGWIFGQSGII